MSVFVSYLYFFSRDMDPLWPGTSCLIDDQKFNNRNAKGESHCSALNIPIRIPEFRRALKT